MSGEPGPTSTPEMASTHEGERIAKRIARSGYCSRRDAERLIAEGRVAVDGTPIESPALNVTAAQEIRIDGERLKAAEPTRLFRYYKPEGVVTTARDPEGRPTVTERLGARSPRHRAAAADAGGAARHQFRGPLAVDQ